MTTPTLTDEMKLVADNLKARGWIQGAMEHRGSVCAHGAVMTCQGLRPGDAYIIRSVMRTKGFTEAWNDADFRTEQEVMAALLTMEVTDADLAATFGPSWQLVVAVIRRAAVLSRDEANQMAAAWDAAWDAAGAAAWAAAGAAAGAAARAAAGAAARAAARDAAGAAARAAARAAAWDAAGDAAGAAAWDAAGAAARAAARAAAVTDLVGQHGLTQDHIDTLTKPWTAALGSDWNEGTE